MPGSEKPSAGPGEALAEFYRQIEPDGLAPLWESLHNLVTAQPRTPAQPILWDYDRRVRPHLMRSGELVTAEQAERRVLILENPGLRGRAAATHSLYAGVQLVLPGEIARAHRHSQSALRLVLESDGAYTTVNGERIAMAAGDLVTTPSWTWHDHGNQGAAPAVWVDVLDVPLVATLDASFAEPSVEAAQTVAIAPGAGLARFGRNMLPVDWQPLEPYSPIFHYPYALARATLAELAEAGEPDACHGYKMRHVNPATGDFVLPTIGTFLQALPAGFEGAPYRATDATVCIAMEGEGETRIGATVLGWKPRDIFVIPAWATYRHRTPRGAVLFSASDRPAQRKLGLWREQRGV